MPSGEHHHAPAMDHSHLRHRCHRSGPRQHSRSHPATSSQYHHQHHMTTRSLDHQPTLQHRRSSSRSRFRCIRGRQSRPATHVMTPPRPHTSSTHHSSTHPQAHRHRRPHISSTHGSARPGGRTSSGSGSWTTSRAAPWPSAATRTATRAVSSATRRSTRCIYSR